MDDLILWGFLLTAGTMQLSILVTVCCIAYRKTHVGDEQEALLPVRR
jgi:hypothetical protein